MSVTVATRNREQCEADNRMHWTLCELGAFPSPEQLRAIREFREDERHEVSS